MLSRAITLAALPAAALAAALPTHSTAIAETRQAESEAAPAFTHGPSGAAGDRYAAWIKKSWKAAGASARTHLARARKAKAAGKTGPALTQHYARAIAADGKTAQAWIGIAETLLATNEANLRGAALSNTRSNAAGAAWNGYRFASRDQTRARALDLLATALERQSYWRPAIAALKASLALTPDATRRARYDTLRAKHGFRITNYRVESNLARPRACISFSEPLQAKPETYAPFLTLNGKDVDGIELDDRQICVPGLAHGERAEIVVRKGLAARGGDTFDRSATLSLFVKDRAPAVRFKTSSYVLPRAGQNGIPVTTVNTSGVDVEVFRISDRGLAQAAASGELFRELGRWNLKEIASTKGERVFGGRLETRIDRNREVVTAIPVADTLGTPKPGVYVMAATAADSDRPRDAREVAAQWFIISDLGLTTVSADDGVHAFVRSLATAAETANVKLQLIARNNETLATATTDARGYARFAAGAAKGEGGMAPAILTAETSDGDFAFLDLTRAAFDLTDRGVTGRNAPGPIDGFVYTDRGVYRPGETVQLAALVRTANGRAATLPTTLIVARPDGVEHARIVLKDQGAGGRAHPLRLAGSAMTGTWRLKLHVDPKAKPIAETAVLVEDFVPERLALDLATTARTLEPGSSATIDVTGRYLYGPPAVDLGVDGEIIVTPAANDADHPGFTFGDTNATVTPVRAQLKDTARTGADGKTAVAVSLPPIPRTARPLTAKVMLRLREPSGRVVERSRSFAVRAGLTRIGLRPQFKDGAAKSNTDARFDVIAVNGANTATGLKGAEWRLKRLQQRYQWYKRYGRWAFESVTYPTKVADGRVDIGTDKSSVISAPVAWGRYRLEVTARTADGKRTTTAIVFNAGWHQSETPESPEVLDVGVAKPSYHAGETAELRVRTRAGGRATIAVLGQSLVAQKTLDLPAGDSTIDLPVTADWGAGAYATVILHRPMETKRKRMPSRALGLVWIKRDLSDAALNVTIGGPEKVRSGGTVTLPISVAGGTPGEPAFVTVAAVDAGILNLTGFKAPNPSRVLEGQTKLGAEIRDLYGRLIDGMSAEAGSFRTGGDADGGPQMQGPPPVEATVALFSGIVAVDGDGNAQVTFDLPPFNGSVRLMAVAWNGAQIGHGTRDMTVRDPVALTLGAPRFLTLGDTTKLRVDAHNVEGPSGDYRVTVRSALDGAPARDVLAKTVTLAPNARQAIVVPFAPRDVGLTTVTVTVAGPDGIAVTRDLTFDVKPAAGDIKRHLVQRLGEGESITLSADLFADMIARDAQVGVSVGPAAQFDVPGLLASLDRYPYGCTEQTISRALPLLYANALSADGGLATDKELGPRIEKAVARVLARQDSSGAFGIWSPYGSNMWLTAYAADFLSRAREAGYAISERAFAQTLDRLANYVGYTQEVRDGGAELSYALYVLARHKRAAAGTLRYFAEARLSDFQSAAAKAQLGAALAMIGDTDRARRVFANAAARATATTDKAPREDFGSAVRDAAAVVALAAEARMLSDVGTALDQLKAALAKRPALSTQDQAWAVRAAAALSTQASDVQLDVGGTPHTGALTRMFTHASLSDGAVTIRNTGPATDLIVTTTGSAKTPEPAAANGFAIERAYYTLDGKPIDLASARGGQSTVQQTERMVVVLTVRPEERTGRLLLVDRLPAGLEIENPRLVDGGSISALSWLTSPVQPVHTEFRDDRFVAAFDLFKQRQQASSMAPITVAYVVRAVQPGRYVHPAATIEDMYRPQRNARTATGRLTVTEADDVR